MKCSEIVRVRHDLHAGVERTKAIIKIIDRVRVHYMKKKARTSFQEVAKSSKTVQTEGVPSECLERNQRRTIKEKETYVQNEPETP